MTENPRAPEIIEDPKLANYFPDEDMTCMLGGDLDYNLALFLKFFERFAKKGNLTTKEYRMMKKGLIQILEIVTINYTNQTSGEIFDVIIKNFDLDRPHIITKEYADKKLTALQNLLDIIRDADLIIYFKEYLIKNKILPFYSKDLRENCFVLGRTANQSKKFIVLRLNFYDSGINIFDTESSERDRFAESSFTKFWTEKGYDMEEFKERCLHTKVVGDKFAAENMPSIF